ncbi:G-protein coupled receptor 4-like [Melanotaenia boesemani]|uniref:G-protein coupled receptor 4-like n=1 Tax=Melanotaenia boesemani TaxID=1250792 RepID=UPI001C047FB3|nr:G-protein coupled receptor 4-like [Melanotaenia boesemani]
MDFYSLYDYSNGTDYLYYNYSMFEEFNYLFEDGLPPVSYVIAWIVIWICFPLILLAIYALHSLIRDDNVAPVYVINLLISDIIQICCFGIWTGTGRRFSRVIYVSILIYYFGVLASVGFMMCVALERFLVVACPLWYRFRRSVRFSAVVSFVVWITCLIELLVALLTSDLYQLIFRFIFLLLPLPLLTFFLAGTVKVISSARSVPSEEKRRIVGILVLVLLIYTLLFMPSVIQLLKMILYRYPLYRTEDSYYGFHLSFLQFSPLADLVLYVFMRKGAPDKLLACLCCCNVMKEEGGGQSSDMTTEDISSVQVLS